MTTEPKPMTRANTPFVRAARSLRLVPLAVVVAVTALAPAGGIAAQDATPEVTPGVIEAPAAETPCLPAEGDEPTPTPAPAAARTYEIASEESAVRYRVQEELASVGATEAVGTTTAFIGQILFDEGGLPMACSRFDVDMRTLTSDSARRDNYLYGNTLQTEEFPLATFILTGVEGLDGELPDDAEAETTFIMLGNLTLHGVTNRVAWEATVTRDGDDIRGSAYTTFEMPNFAIVPPTVGPVVSLDETVRLEVDIVARVAGD
ncbi:MAG: YceI family protein [Chloroflexota bacterium]|nr:YceI family protein [Chloroflexota bacterium]